jgi:hypothetical protein
MKITERIQLHRDAIIANPGGSTDRMIQDQSVAAIINGKASVAWHDYMSNFSSNDPQLQRLLGNDQAFMNHSTGWGPIILAYIVSGGVCGGGTGLSLPADMSTPFKQLLDGGLPTETDNDQSGPLDAEPNFISTLV